MSEVNHNFTDFDRYLFHEGTDKKAYMHFGAFPMKKGKKEYTRFSLWAPNALKVSVITDKNGWNPEANYMEKSPDGIWHLDFDGVKEGDTYKYVVTGQDGVVRYKADPYAFSSELRPSTASVVTKLKGYKWHDSAYLKRFSGDNVNENPMAVYEVHLGSWKKNYSLNKDGFLNYRELADELSEYVKYMGYTHIELIGICEHPLDASWGYQVTGYYSPTKRHGSPDDFRYFVDTMHKNGIGVILDWVPAHFPRDDFALGSFDGTAMYEHFDPLRSTYPQWGTLAFDHGKPEVRSFLISNAFYWINEFHIDALRVDAVASMLHNSFGRSEWRLNSFGGLENLESISLLKQINYAVRHESRGFMIAEDSSIMKGITDNVEDGGIGFSLKWNMGWMHELLEYIKLDPLYRGWHHGELTHSADYSFLENFMLVLSHDEVVHLKRSMLEKMYGNELDKMGCLKSVYTYMFTHPGKKLLFMGQDFGEDKEWIEDREISWYLADVPGHRDIMESMRKLLSIYKKYPCLYSDSRDNRTFSWVNRYDGMRSTISYIRKNPWNFNSALLVVCSFAPVMYNNYTVGVPVSGNYKRIFSTCDYIDGVTECPDIISQNQKCDGFDFRLEYNLRPYEAAIFEIPCHENTAEK